MKCLGVVAGILFVASAGCFNQPKIDAGSLKCKSDENCPTGYQCGGATSTVLGVCTRSAADGAIADALVGLVGEAGQAADVSSIDSSGMEAIDGENLVAVADGSSDQSTLASDDGAADFAMAPGDGQLSDSPAAAPEVGADVPITGNGGAGGGGGAGGATSSEGTAGLGVGGGATSLGGTTGLGGGVGTATGGIVGSGGLPGTGGVIATGGVVGSGGTTVPPVDCGPLSGPPNGSVSYLETTVGETATYSCGPGYGPSGSSTRYCLANGSWSGTAPACVPANCPGLPSPTNGLVSAPTLTFNSTATYSCSTGYSLVGGASRTCQADGTWSGTAPTCPPVDCLALTAPAKGSVHATTTTYNSTATYSCDTGYQLSDSTARKCLANGIWSGSAPTCSLVDCGKLTDPTNGSVSVSATTYNSTAIYSCASNYDLSGSASRTCQADGTWSGTAPRCTPKGCPAGTHNGGDGTCVALYTCVTGYHNGSTGKCVVDAPCLTDQLTDDSGVCVSMAGSTWVARVSSPPILPGPTSDVATSADGMRVVVTGHGDQSTYGFIYGSTDFGATWAPLFTTSDFYDFGITSSADGSRIVAVGSSILTSSDYGAHWAQQIVNTAPYAVASSADGSRVVRADLEEYIYTSQTYGTTWTQRGTVTAHWARVTSSADGSKLVAVASSGVLLTSTDYGNTWTQPNTNTDWLSVASSSDGNRLVAGTTSGLYASTDFGVTWKPLGTNFREGDRIASSADGSKLIGVAKISGITDAAVFTSTDFGATWFQRTVPPGKLASSADGTHLVVISDSGTPYTSSGPTR